jgi:hypothetical protein
LARNAIANPKPAPTKPAAAKPMPIVRIRDRWAPARHSSAPDTLPAAHSVPTMFPIGHKIPAAVTTQLVTAAGTRRASSRAVVG